MHLDSIGLKLACWTGGNLSKGLALAARPELKLTAKPIRGIQWAIQGRTERGLALGVVAAWACATEHSENRYIRQIHKLLDRNILKSLPLASIFLGDFNSNSIWDAEHRERSHSRVVEKFDIAGYRSAYHEREEELHGKESTPTFFLYRNRKHPYHIDYAFLSPRMRRNLKSVEIGTPANWLRWSDHMPFSLSFRNKHRLTSARRTISFGGLK